MAYINLDDVVLHYEVYGNGVPLILLHGNGENMQYFHNQIPVFSVEYRVICIDTRGHGGSTRGSKSMSFSTFCDDLYQFIEALQIMKAHILGFSDGANTALYFACKYPDKIAGLVLNSPNLYPKGLLDILWIQMKGKYACLKAVSFLSKKAQRELELLRLMIDEPNLNEQMISHIQLNALLIVGEKDMIKMMHTRVIARSLPHCVLRIIPNADHFLAMKKPEIFNQEILKFLAGFH